MTLSVNHTFVGQGNWSLDATSGSATDGGVVDALIPTGSTIEAAFLYASTFLNAADSGSVDFNGTPLAASDFIALGSTSGANLQAFRADVTDLVAAAVGSGANVPFSFDISNVGSNNVDGYTLAIIYSNPNEPTRSIIFVDGSSAPAGDTFAVNFPTPIDTTVDDFSAQLSLGIGFSAQGAGADGGVSAQFSTVNVDGRRLTSFAGGQDDGSTGNGALITTGGIGNNPANPANPFAAGTDPGFDDELYNLAQGNAADATPFLANGANSVLIQTLNPSNDDNIFFAGFNFVGSAIVDSGENDRPTAVNDGVSTFADRALASIPVLTNDIDPDGDPLSITALDTTSTRGLVVLNADGTVSYDPNGQFDALEPGETATDTFSYTISDGNGGVDTATVSVTVEGPALLELTLPSELAVGDSGAANVTFNNGAPTLLVLTAERGLLADPRSGQFTESVFIIGNGSGGNATVDVDVKGSAGPRSAVSATAQLADPNAIADIAARYTALQPAYADAAALSRIEANLVAQFGETVSSLASNLATHAHVFESFGLNASSATAALAFALEAAGDYGSLVERSTVGSLGQGWATLADLGLDIDGASVQMRGLTTIDALRALSLEASALYTISNSAGRSVALSGDVLALSAPPRPTFEQGANGQFVSTSAFDGTLQKTGTGYVIDLPDGDTLIFDAEGRFLRMEMADGLEIVATHDATGRITGLSGPNGANLAFSRNADGAIEQIEDADGATTAFAYDANGRLAVVTRAEGVSSFVYDASGDLAGTVAPGGISGTFTYDAFGRLASANYGGGLQTETFSYDGAGGLTITDGAGRTTQIDLLPGSVAGRLADGLGHVSEIVYGSDGVIAGVRAPDGTLTGFQFDDQQRLVQIVDANGAEASFTYQGASEDPSSFTDAGGSTRLFSYDAGGRITQATWPDGTQLTFDYDANGNLTGYANRRGDAVTYTHDARGRLLSESDSSAGATSYTYDAGGRLISATNDQGTTSLAYDSADRVTQIDYPTGRSLFYTYNEAGLRASISDGGDYNVFYDYDALGRLTGLRDEDSSLVAYSYDGAGNLVREANGNGTVSSYEYDNAGRLTLIENHAPDDSFYSRQAYTYDAAGQRVGVDTLDGSWAYGYDAAGQLTSAVFASTNPAIADKSLTYEYDAAGNRTRVVEDGVETLYSANALNQYTQVGDETFTYDADGNMISRTDASGTTAYAYDLDNRLISVTEADGTVLEFSYDAFGNRVGKTVDGVEVEYLIDPFGLGNVVSEFEGGALSATYAHGLGLTAAEIGGAEVWYDADAVGSVTTLTGSDSGVVNSYAYTPFGTQLREVEGIENAYEFNGALGVAEDSDQLNFMRSRSYAPELGRFSSEDPLWLSGDNGNLYRFSLNDPNLYADPDGELIGFVIGAVVRLVTTNAATTLRVVGAAGAVDAGYEGGQFLGAAAYDPRPGRVQEEGVDAAVSILGLGLGKFLKAFLPPQKALAGELWLAANEGPVEESLQGLMAGLGSGSASKTTAIGASGGDARNDGDPHLRTFDGTGYSFQAVGEFTMVLGDGFEMQTRTEAINDFVSVNTATAMNIGDNVVGIYARQDRPLVINGTTVALEKEQTIAVGDGTVYRGTFGSGDNFDVYVVTDGQGNGFWVNVYAGANHLRPFVADGQPISGLLGNLDGDRSNDFQLRDGTVLGRPLPQDVLYGDYADSWRITQGDSLFVYADGESTEAFTNRSFPTRIITLSDLDPAIRAAAEAHAIAAGLTPGTFAFETTVIDIALTGNPIFAEGVAGAPVFAADGQEIETVPAEIDEKPVAQDDTANVAANGTVEIDVLQNDTDPESRPLTLLQGSDPNGGVVEVVGGRLRFTPAQNFAGITLLSYIVADAAGNRDTGSVQVDVVPELNAPIAVDDVATVGEDSAVEINALNNDTDADGDILTFVGVGAPSSGTASIVEGRIVYTPNANFFGGDSFAYTISDGKGGQATATIAVTVNPVNDAPIADGDAAATEEDVAIAIDVLGNDTDADTDALSIASIAQAAHGAVVINANGTVSYTPNADFNGTDSFEYTVTDGVAESATATVNVTVTPVNDGPVARDDAATTQSNAVVAIDAIANDVDIDGDPISIVSIDSSGILGLASIGPDGTILYDPNGQFDDLADGQTATESFTYTVADGRGGTDVATVNVSVTGFDAAPNLIIGTNRRDFLLGTHENDEILGQGGHDDLFGRNGDDVIEGGDGGDQIFGDRGDDMLDGGKGHDALFGGLDDDRLQGGSGRDDLFGGLGNDVLNGGEGNDYLSGGFGRDLFIVTLNGDTDIIIDFDADHDQLDLTAFDFSSLEHAKISAYEQRHGVVFAFEDGTSAYIKHADLDDFNEDNLIIQQDGYTYA